MTKIIGLLLIIFSTSIFSKEIKVNFSADWKKDKVAKKSSSELLMELEKEIIVPIDSHNDLKVTMEISQNFPKDTPSDYSKKDAYFIKSKIFDIQGKKEKLLGTPKIITLLGKEASISITSDDGENLELKVLLSEN